MEFSRQPGSPVLAAPLVSRYLLKYLFLEVGVGFLMGTVIFLLIMLAFQAIRLTDLIIFHQVSFAQMAQLSYYLMYSFLPLAIPVAFLFSVLLGISRANSEGEVLALQVNGVSIGQIFAPVLLFSALLTAFCLQASLYSVPKGNRGFELLVTKLSAKQMLAALRPGVFIEGFYGMVLFSERIDQAGAQMHRVFLYDERDPERPYAIAAQAGMLSGDPGKSRLTLRLLDGAIHVDRPARDGVQQKITFDVYDINLQLRTGENAWRDYSLPSMSYTQLKEQMGQAGDPRRRLEMEVELHRRISLSFACIVFGAMGFFIALLSKRGIRSSAIVLCLGVAVVYWLCYVAASALAAQGRFAPWLGIWLPNFLFLAVPVLCYRKYVRGA